MNTQFLDRMRQEIAAGERNERNSRTEGNAAYFAGLVTGLRMALEIANASTDILVGGVR